MSFWDDIKKFAQPYGDDEDYDDYDDEDLDEGYEEEEAAPRYTKSAADTGASSAFGSGTGTAFAASNTSAASSGFAGTVINGGMNSSSKHQLVLLRPESFNDAPVFATNLRDKKAVVLNLEGVDKNLGRRVVDFLSGCCYSLDGSVKKVSQATYMFCPRDMEVVGDLKSLQGEVENYI